MCLYVYFRWWLWNSGLSSDDGFQCVHKCWLLILRDGCWFWYIWKLFFFNYKCNTINWFNYLSALREINYINRGVRANAAMLHSLWLKAMSMENVLNFMKFQCVFHIWLGNWHKLFHGFSKIDHSNKMKWNLLMCGLFRFPFFFFLLYISLDFFVK